MSFKTTWTLVEVLIVVTLVVVVVEGYLPFDHVVWSLVTSYMLTGPDSLPPVAAPDTSSPCRSRRTHHYCVARSCAGVARSPFSTARGEDPIGLSTRQGSAALELIAHTCTERSAAHSPR